MRAPIQFLAFGVSLPALLVAYQAHAADLILNNQTLTLGGVQTYGVVHLTNGSRIQVRPFNGSDRINTGNLVLRANSIIVDATSSISARGSGYQATLCGNGPGPTTLSGGRGGCSVRDSAGGGAHFGNGGRGTKDCSAGYCVFPRDWEESCDGSPVGTQCSSLSDCRNNDGLPTVAGLSFWHSIYDPEFGAAGGDKGCRDGDGFSGSMVTGGDGGGRIVLFAANDSQSGELRIDGTIDVDGNRGCGHGNDSAGGGAGGTLVVVGDSVTIGATASLTARGGRGGDTQPKSDPECAGTQTNGTCDDCGGGGGGGIISVLSRVSSIHPQATFDVRGGKGGICPICEGEAGGGAGELQIDGAYVGEFCDGKDNDFDGLIDEDQPVLTCPNGQTIPSCAGGVPQNCPADVPACLSASDTRPRFVVIVDTSGSMTTDLAGNPTFGDGSQGHLGVDTSSDPDTIDGNNSRLYMAKNALRNVISAFPNVDYALARYYQDVSLERSCQTASWFECTQSCCSYDDPRNNITPAIANPPGCLLTSLYPSAGYPAALNSHINIGWANQNDCINYAGSCGRPRQGGQVVAGFGSPTNQYLMWLDHKETNFSPSTLPGNHCDFAGGGDCEFRGTGPTPLAGSLQATEFYLEPIVPCDSAIPCRKYGVILLTDGAESCQGDPVAAAASLRNKFPGVTIDTYVVGFSVQPSERDQLNAIAAAGSGGTRPAFFVGNEDELANAVASIVANSTVFEVCNGLDDDCDGLIDEDFPDKGTACNDGQFGICLGTGERVCTADGTGTRCEITHPGSSPADEICNGLDDNCNGLIDEGTVCETCVPQAEVCDGLDNDCNNVVDDNLVDTGQPCGLSLGTCEPGVTVCNAGHLECDGAVPPSTELCNGFDDNCDGVVDGITRPCYGGPEGTAGVGVCRAGTSLCTAVPDSGQESWGECVGQVLPSAEVCDGLDNDCNGQTDDAVSDGQGHETGQECCRFADKCGVGQCTFGQYACAGSIVVCDGGQGPTAERCDGIDNDCNGVVDDVPGRGTSCALPGGCAGVLECNDITGQLECQPSTSLNPETCNRIDDDCDGFIDEEPEVSENDPAVGVECDVPQAPNDQGACQSGLTVCVNGVVTCEGSVRPTEELCDGLDNDCDGVVDSPEPCAEGLKCIDGICAARCKGGEFPCPGGQVCRDDYCVPAPCNPTANDCPAGQQCIEGKCVSVQQDAGTEDAPAEASTDGSSGEADSGGHQDAGKDSGSGQAADASADTGTGSDSSPDVQTSEQEVHDWGLATGGGGCTCTTGPKSGSAWGWLAGLAAAVATLCTRRRARGSEVTR